MTLKKVLNWPIALCVVMTLLLLLAPPSYAANINQTPDPIMGCFIELEGEIAAGDAKKIPPLIEELYQADAFRFDDANIRQKKGRVCLNSPGGSLVEAVALAKFFRESSVGTAVGRGKSCLSACAVAFMGGTISYENDTGSQPDRVLHPLGKLGFHAPDLGVPVGQYDEKAVKKAYLIALQGVSSLMDISADIQFPTSLFSTMLATPPDDMHIIATLGEAALWRIAIAPILEPAALTKQGVLNGCNNIDAAAQDTAEWYNQSGSGITVSGGSGEMEDGYRQEAATGCSFSFLAQKKGHAGRTLPSGWGYISDFSVHTWPYQTLHPKTLVNSVALENDSQSESISPQEQSLHRQTFGRCIVFRGSQFVDNDPCQMMQVARRSQDFLLHEIYTFTWPSGAKTVVENVSDLTNDNTATKLNGVSTERDLAYKNMGLEQAAKIRKYAAEHGNNNPVDLCWLNPATGNRFCFLDDKPVETSMIFRGFEE